MTLELELAYLKLAYRMRDWDGVREALEWLDREGYLNASLLVPPLRIDQLKQRAERTRRGSRMGLLALTTAYAKRDWNEVGRLVQHLEMAGYLR